MSVKAWKPVFQRDDVDIRERAALYDGFFRLDQLRLRHRLYQGGWSEEIRRELFVRHRAVGVLPWDPERDELLLIEQFRVGALDYRDNPWCLEIIAGIADKENECLETLARREAQEEAGIRLDQLIVITDYLVSPGGSNERMLLYLATANLDGADGIYGHPDEAEDIRVVRLPVAELPEVLAAGVLDNAPALIALQWFQANHDQLRHKYRRM